MDHPLCKLCKHRHPLNAGHIFDDVPQKKAINKPSPINTSSINKVIDRKKSPNGRKREDYNAYMREYMKRRRANHAVREEEG